ncbi:hypothetical protein NW762_013395 [Fusarium torreyae]|uniref:Secreted protein n=1 Tax=Fusarium torreyae TaxID=1237075 RepID=A0A9W8RKP6_9HYPO|nr:hypothetical protein NW762_013395 [Fusarium torreyae]
MHRTLVISALLGALVSAVALPEDEGLYIRSTEEMTFEGLPIVDLQITDDENFPGVVFNGTVQSIVEQMEALKPGIFNPASSGSDNSELEASSLEKRQGTINCNWGKEKVLWSHCFEGMEYLRNLAGRRCGVGPAGGACARVSCSHGCGIYLCNRLSTDNSVWCNNIPNDIQRIGEACISQTLGWFKGAQDWPNHYTGVAKDNC